MEVAETVKPAAFQGGDEIVIHAPIARVWQLIADSKELENWGPPVRQVVVHDVPEVLGSRRTVTAEMTSSGVAVTAEESATVKKKQVVHFVERRIEHVEGRKIGYRIEEDDMGLSKAITEVGFTMELEELSPRTTRIVWNFFQNPKGIFGRVMTPLFIRPRQRANRLAALRSLKRCAELNAHGETGPDR